MPQFIKEKCVSCSLCSTDCPASVIDVQNKSIADDCIHCGHCVAVCPHQAMQMNNDVPVMLPRDDFDFSNFEALVKNTRSCRHYKAQSIDQDILERLVDMLAHAPSGANVRNVELSVFTKKEQVKLINDRTMDAMLKAFKMAASPLVNPLLRLFKGKTMANKMKRYAQSFENRKAEAPDSMLYGAPTVVVLHGSDKGVGLNHTDAQLWTAYLCLAARTLGLGSCYIGFSLNALNRNAAFRQEVGIPKEHKVHSVITLGYSSRKYKNEVQRSAPKATFH